jgi:hypothetical protein
MATLKELIEMTQTIIVTPEEHIEVKHLRKYEYMIFLCDEVFKRELGTIHTDKNNNVTHVYIIHDPHVFERTDEMQDICRNRDILVLFNRSEPEII